MKTIELISTQRFDHESETVKIILDYLISHLKPTKKHHLIIKEYLTLYDYGNEYFFLLKFNVDKDNRTIQNLDIATIIITSPKIESDFLYTVRHDQTNNHHFITLCFTK